MSFNKHFNFLLILLIFINYFLIKKIKSINNLIYLILFSFLGMIIPDIDHKGSYINKYNIFIKSIKNILNHRSFTHSFFFLLLIILFIKIVFNNIFIILGIIIGIISHLIIDLFTPMGIEIFWPIKIKFKINYNIINKFLYIFIFMFLYIIFKRTFISMLKK